MADRPIVQDEDIITLDDGYRYFWPKDWPCGALSASHLRAIANYLDDLNRDWNNQIKSYFNDQEKDQDR